MRFSAWVLGAVAAAICIVAAPVDAAVPVTDAAGLKKQVAARRGKVVVVNLWATWCGPCVKEYPALIGFGKTNAAKGVSLVTVSFDTPGRDSAKVAAFVKKNGQTAGAYLNKAGLDPEGYPQFLEPKLSPNADFPLPRTYIFDREGKLVKTIVEEVSAVTLQKAVAPYL